ncbi:MAG: protein-disulfide reductase DsbD N-terminal domain-containing protein [Opitutaceae bacterium]|nr:protein-disulfide reductase DsbD N-terminal domain-containing protein [Opitutaceae bacterium]
MPNPLLSWTAPLARRLWLGLLLGTATLLGANPGSNLKVLYVGGSSNWEKETYATPEAAAEDVTRRMASFEAMLKKYFTSVTVMHASDYRQKDSLAYDVTVMDGTPTPLSERRVVRDATGRVTEVIPARYFTEDFSRPVVVIGELGEKLGRSIGLKFDWYCLCLDAHAHGFRAEHPIFKGPFPVRMTIEERPTPEDAFHYAYYRTTPTPKSLPMWRVQTKGYQSDRGFRIGMVARPWGFEDSPDAETISSGVCQKGLDAVAIGRHGNFFCWGFAASPEFMTDEACTVLANGICYIARFTGQGLLARKYHDRRATKHWITELKYLATREAYEDYCELNRRHNERMTSTRREAEARKLKGEKLTQIEEISLGYRPGPMASFEDTLRNRFKDLYPVYGTDVAAYHRYYDENFDYFYSEAPFYKLVVDEDAKAAGIPNTHPRILAWAIEQWEKNTDVERARRILKRYTLLDYETAGEWRAWYDQNRSRLFFTETGGFVFMVNSRDPKVEGNDYARKRLSLAYGAIAVAETDPQNPVSVAAGVAPRGDGKKEIVVKLKVHPGYHIYSHVSPRDAFAPARIDIRLPAGYTFAGELEKPAFQPYGNDPGTGIYRNEFRFTREISGSGAGEVKVTVSYQCCDAHICFPPDEQVVTVKLD